MGSVVGLSRQDFKRGLPSASLLIDVDAIDQVYRNARLGQFRATALAVVDGNKMAGSIRNPSRYFMRKSFSGWWMLRLAIHEHPPFFKKYSISVIY